VPSLGVVATSWIVLSDAVAVMVGVTDWTAQEVDRIASPPTRPKIANTTKRRFIIVFIYNLLDIHILVLIT
jgi:hypothetical protein